VAVDFDNLFHRGGFEKCRCHALFDTKNNTTACGYTDCCGAELDCFQRVFDLEETAFWGEGASRSLVSAEARKLWRVETKAYLIPRSTSMLAKVSWSSLGALHYVPYSERAINILSSLNSKLKAVKAEGSWCEAVRVSTEYQEGFLNDTKALKCEH